jgi:hypothetical protein
MHFISMIHLLTKLMFVTTYNLHIWETFSFWEIMFSYALVTISYKSSTKKKN